MAKFTLQRGLSDIYVAEVTADTAEAFTTGTPYQLIPAGEMSVTVDTDSEQYYFDNTVFATVGREGASELTISGAALRADAIAALNGKDVDATTGAVLDSGQFVNNKYFALGAKKSNIDGTEEYFWFMKGSFSIPDENAQTAGDDTEANGTELTYAAIPTIHKFNATNKVCKRTIIDTETTAIVEGGDWFAQVVTPDNLGTVVTAATPASV